MNFTHLHVHSQYSILDGAASVSGLVNKAKEFGMTAIALTDHGNMYGIKHFFDEAKQAGIKPILGCETYVADKTRFDKTDKDDRSGAHLIILAKNKTGYKNLTKLISLAYTDGFYYKARIDKDILVQYKEGLIVSSACLGGEIPQLIMKGYIKEAKKSILWFKEHFGEDFYLEMMKHKSGDPRIDRDVYENQIAVNKTLIELSKEFDIKLIATNDVHFLNAEDAEAHDRLICLNTGKDLDDPDRLRYTKQEYLKSAQEMADLFPDTPEAITNTMEVAEKVEEYELDSPPIMPNFTIPEQFSDADDYLRHITYEGAKERYPDITKEIKERLDFELETIKNMGFPGYFLIVWDFIKAARELGVIVGPGRGSAAGSAVAYCIKITNIDPIKYDLLFERFLNPDRISMPDIDIDFDDDGRQEVMDWVVDKYGYNKVSQIVTFGTMAAKMAIRDVSRVQGLPLPEADRLAKLVPEGPKVTLTKAYNEVPELKEAKTSGNENVRTTLRYAEILEGCVRQTGIHACGIIIGRDDLTEHIPVSTSKESHLLITQFDGRFVESVGMLKMDFLGLKTLSIIKDTLENVKWSKGIDIDIDNIPLDDKETYELYARGDTTALFQFESTGMKKHLRSLKPNRFEDLVAMNALYRPGPMDYIPSFIKRKHGLEEIHYDHPMMEPFLKDTYGITVYQEQVMLQSRALGGFTRGQSDSLRKAMGKKKIKLMNELKVKFIEGCKANPEFIQGCKEVGKEPDKLIEKIWTDWEAFAKYAFNKSHSVCYARVSYQTAYLKAHYPGEFMSAVLSRNLNDIKKITIFMDECKRMGIKVLGPDVNESFSKFTVNKEGAIRFGMAAIKGLGENAVRDIIKEREKKGLFTDIFNFAERINFRTVNKKSIEKLAIAGAFDSFKDISREHFFASANGHGQFVDVIVKYGTNIQFEKSNAQQNLFGDIGGMEIPKPKLPEIEEWSTLEKLNQEKELVGIYLSAHPLDDYRLEIDTWCTTKLSQLNDLESLKGKEIVVGGIVTNVEHRTTKTGKPFGSFALEDFSDVYKFVLFSRDYTSFREYMYQNNAIVIWGKVQEKPYREGELEVKVQKMDYLSEMRDKISDLAIKIPIDKLTGDLIEHLTNLAEKNKGSSELHFLVYDPLETKTWVSLFSRTHKINVNDDILQFLDSKPELDYRIK